MLGFRNLMGLLNRRRAGATGNVGLVRHACRSGVQLVRQHARQCEHAQSIVRTPQKIPPGRLLRGNHAFVAGSSLLVMEHRVNLTHDSGYLRA